jgi:GTP cyclohydrolase I
LTILLVIKMSQSVCYECGSNVRAKIDCYRYLAKKQVEVTQSLTNKVDCKFNKSELIKSMEIIKGLQLNDCCTQHVISYIKQTEYGYYPDEK